MMRADNPDDGLGSSAPPQIQQFLAHTNRLQQRYQAFLDSTTPYPLHRWAATAGLLFLFMLRIIFSQGWYIVCYALFIYLLNLFLAFLTPKFDPSYEADLAEQDVEEGEPGLPTSASASKLGSTGGTAAGGLMSGVFGSSLNGQSTDDEFRPFIRRLPEFKFWHSATQAVVISLFCTLSSAFDIPVFWPILLMYFCILFTITMRRQIKYAFSLHVLALAIYVFSIADHLAPAFLSFFLQTHDPTQVRPLRPRPQGCLRPQIDSFSLPHLPTLPMAKS